MLIYAKNRRHRKNDISEFQETETDNLDDDSTITGKLSAVGLVTNNMALGSSLEGI